MRRARVLDSVRIHTAPTGDVDGRSQPLMLVADIEAESGSEGIAHWAPHRAP